MKPNTIETLIHLVGVDIKGQVEELFEFDIQSAENFNYRNLAMYCRNIIDAAEALENVLLTAADEDDRIELAVAESFENIQFVSHEEHLKMHSRKEESTE